MRWSEELLYRLVADAHAAPEWACLRHVRSGAGWDRRTCDALAMSLWQSRGLILRGFEIKVARADWKRESEDPEKAEAIATYCDEWWIVAAPGVVRDPEIELPPAWGLMVPDDSGKALTITRKAERGKGAPPSRGFLAQLFKGAQEGQRSILRGSVPEEQITERIEAARAAGQAQGERESSHALTSLRSLQASVARFRDATGIDPESDQTTGDWEHRVHGVLASLALGSALRGRYGSDLDQITKMLTAVRDLSSDALQRVTEVTTEKGKTA